MIEPYTAVGLIPSFWGIRRRQDIEKNLEHLESLTKAAYWLSSLDIPVRLVAIPEGALQGFNDEVLDVDHAEFARSCAIDSAASPARRRPRRSALRNRLRASNHNSDGARPGAEARSASTASAASLRSSGRNQAAAIEASTTAPIRSAGLRRATRGSPRLWSGRGSAAPP